MGFRWCYCRGSSLQRPFLSLTDICWRWVYWVLRVLSFCKRHCFVFHCPTWQHPTFPQRPAALEPCNLTSSTAAKQLVCPVHFVLQGTVDEYYTALPTKSPIFGFKPSLTGKESQEVMPKRLHLGFIFARCYLSQVSTWRLHLQQLIYTINITPITSNLFFPCASLQFSSPFHSIQFPLAERPFQYCGMKSETARPGRPLRPVRPTRWM